MQGYFAALFIACHLWSDDRNRLYHITHNSASVSGGLQACIASSDEMSPLCTLYSPSPYEFKHCCSCHVGSWSHIDVDESSEMILCR